MDFSQDTEGQLQPHSFRAELENEEKKVTVPSLKMSGDPWDNKMY
jgi:hypothetical protein